MSVKPSILQLLAELKQQSIKIRSEQGQLRVSSKPGSLTPELAEKIRVNREALLEILSSQQSASALIPHRADERYQPFAMNENQQAYWLGRSELVEGGGVAIHLYFEIDASDLDIDRLESAWNKLVQRHDMLRAIVTSDGQQQVLEQVTPVPFIRHQVDEFEPQRMAVREQLSHKNYDLQVWPQHEFHYLTDGQQHTLFISIDCWAVDGWSHQILFNEWLALYQEQGNLKPLPITFRDYLQHVDQSTQGDPLQDPDIIALARDLPPAPELPVKAVTKSERGRFKRHECWLDNESTEQLKAWCHRNGVTVASTLVTIYASVLHLWSSSDRFTVNIPRFNRNSDDPRVLDIVGEFATFSLVGVDFGVPMSFAERVKWVQQEVFKTVAKGVSGVTLLRARNQIMGDTLHMPYVFTNAPESVNQEGVKQTFVDAVEQFGEMQFALSQTPQVWLDCQYHESSKGLYLFWDERLGRFYPQQIEQMFSVYLDLIDELVKKQALPERPAQLPAVSRKLRQSLVLTAEISPPQSLWQRFENTVQRCAEKVAVVSDSHTVSWQELHDAVLCLAVKLSAYVNDEPQQVLVLASKGWQQAAAALACARQGQIVVPLDPSNPLARLQYIAEDTKATVVLFSDDLRDTAKQLDLHTLPINLASAQALEEATQSESLSAHNEQLLTIYTSGSTGQPKGVPVTEKALLNSVDYTLQTFSINEQDVLFGLTQLHHDMAWFDLLACVVSGATLVYPTSADYRNSGRWVELIRQHQVTVWNSVPQLMQMLNQELSQRSLCLPSVKVAFLGGDWIPLTLHSEMVDNLPDCQLVSVGGPTETTLWNITYPVSEFNDDWQSIPYGKPITNNRYQIIDRHGRQCPDWVTGEMHCAGVGVTAGYLNRPELNEDKFELAPNGTRWFKTGDLGRYLPDGNIEFIGRADDQVMVGGYRIELQEVRNQLLMLDSISAAEVLVDQDVLKAYVITDLDTLHSSEIHRYLAASLPQQMIPSLYFRVDHIPLTTNGKVDKKALLAVQFSGLDQQEQLGSELQTDAQATIADHWQQILGRRPTSAKDNFFHLGGNSLAAVRLFGLIWPQGHNEHSVVTLFERPTIEKQAELLELSELDQGLVISRTNQTTVPLSRPQQRIRFVEQLSPQVPMFNLPFRIRIGGDVEPERLMDSLAQTFASHRLFQSVIDNNQWHYQQQGTPVIDWVSGELDESQMAALSHEEAAYPFDLQQEWGWRARFARHQQGHHELLLTIHHIIFDGWSLQLLLEEWQQRYAGQCVEANKVDYFDYCVWEQQQTAREEDIAFWRQELAGVQASALSSDLSSTRQSASQSAKTVSLMLGQGLGDELQALADQMDTTLFVVMMSAYQLLVSRYLSQDDVVIGTHVANRNSVDLQQVPGLFLNNLALRMQLEPQWTVQRLIQTQNTKLMAALQHGRLPFEDVVNQVDWPRDSAQHPIYQASFVLDNSAVSDGVLDLSIGAVHQAAISTELEMNIQRFNDDIRVNLVFNQALFSSSMMQRFIEQYRYVLEQMASNPAMPLTVLNYNTAQQAEQLKQKLVGEHFTVPNHNIASLWRQAVGQRGSELAYTDPESSLSFVELDNLADAVAGYLHQMGVGASDKVAVHLPLGYPLVATLIALQKLHACYVPLQQSLPDGRLQTMVDGANCRLAIGDRPQTELGLDYLDIDLALAYQGPFEMPEVSHLSDRPLYITFTSGSTGTPKAVMATEAAALNRFYWSWTHYPFADGEVCALKTSIGFVDSIWELLGPLLQGSTLALIQSMALLEPKQMLDSLSSQQVTRLLAVPSLMENLIENCISCPHAVMQLNSLRFLTLSGEALSVSLASDIRRLLPDVTLVNLYGSAEVAADVLAQQVDEDCGQVAIGCPVFNTCVDIKDNWAQPTPWGGTGEIWVSGPQVIRGYLNGDNDAFIEDGEHFTFKTGDLARVDQQGRVMYCGRNQQVTKIRGQRVSLAEIRETLTKAPGVAQVAVVLVDEQRIGAMCTPATADDHILRQHARQYLPQYMQPQVWQTIDELPSLPTGKVDMHQVKALLAQVAAAPQTINPELTDIEQQLARLWHEITGQLPSHARQSFFDVGGHSLQLNTLVNKLNQQYQLSLPLNLVYNALMLGDMADLVESLLHQYRTHVSDSADSGEIVESGVL